MDNRRWRKVQRWDDHSQKHGNRGLMLQLLCKQLRHCKQWNESWSDIMIPVSPWGMRQIPCLPVSPISQDDFRHVHNFISFVRLFKITSSCILHFAWKWLGICRWLCESRLFESTFGHAHSDSCELARWKSWIYECEYYVALRPTRFTNWVTPCVFVLRCVQYFKCDCNIAINCQ